MKLPPRLGTYAVGDRIGAGGGSVVHRATDAGGRVVALKIARFGDDVLRGDLRREHATLARLSHPGLVRPVAAGLDDEPCWYAMELVAGSDLRAAAGAFWRPVRGLAVDRAALGRLLALVRRVCEPLAYLHGEGVVHGDLKPENLIVRADGAPVILDLGLTKRSAGAGSREELATGNLGGTAAYMAPEQWDGEAADARADLYALGVILHELLTGRLPFRSVAEVRARGGALPLPSRELAGLPPALDDLVAALLAHDPRERLAYADEAAEALARLGGEEGGPGVRSRPYLYRARLAGRGDSLARLEGWMRRRASGPLLLLGEAGVGKTRLAAELALRARGQGIRVIAARCTPPHGAGATMAVPPTRPRPAIAELMDAVVDRVRGGGDRERRRLLGAGARRAALIGELVPQLAEAAEVAPASQVDREEVIVALGDTLIAFAGGAPVLLVIDDLQWADEVTLALFLSLARRTGAPRLLALCRTGGLRPEHAAAVERIELGRLEDRDVGDLAADMLALPRLSEELSSGLVRRSGGNPFVVAETLRAAVAEGLLERAPPRGWRLARRDGELRLPLPESLTELVARRLAGVPAELATVLDGMAVLGRRTRLDLLARVTLVPRERLRDAVARLAVEQILEEPEPDVVAFVHDVVREVVAGAMSGEARRCGHERAALALEEEVAVADGDGELAVHWELGGSPDRARTHYAAAARRALARHAPREAARLYARAIALWPEDDRGAVELRLELASGALDLHGSRADGARILREALALAPAFGEPALDARCRAELGKCLAQSGAPEEARRLLEEALATHRRLGERGAQARILGHLANLWKQGGRHERARSLYEEAIALAEEASARGTLAMNLGNLGNLVRGSAGLDAAAELYARALALAREDGDVRVEETHLSNLASVRLEQGRAEEARTLYAAALALARETGSRRSEGYLLCCMGVVEQRAGASEEARALYGLALEAARELADDEGEGLVLERLAGLELEAGDAREAARLLERALSIAASVGQVSRAVSLMGSLADVRTLLGDDAAARLLRAGARSLEPAADAGDGSSLDAVLAALRAPESSRPP